MSYHARNTTVSGSSGGPGFPRGVWRPANGIVFSAGPAPSASPAAEASPKRRAVVFGHTSSFDQAPSYGQVPAFGRAPSFGHGRRSARASSFGQAESLEQSFSFEQASSFGNTSFGRASFGSTSFGSSSGSTSFEGTSSSGGTSFHRAQTHAHASKLPSFSQQPYSGKPPRDPPARRTTTTPAQPVLSQPSRPTFRSSQQGPSRLGRTSPSGKRHSSHDAQAAAARAKEPEADGNDDDIEPPETDLDFKMSKTLFNKARKAAPGTPESYWSYTMYRNKAASSNNAEGAGGHPRIQVHYCKSKETTERVCKQYFENEPMLGFDLEWMAEAAKWQGPRRNVCLLQLSSPSRIGLFHLSLFPSQELMTPTLRKILESPDIIKAGVFIRGDATRLRNHLAINMQGLIELSQLHRLVKYTKTGEHKLISKRLVSLASQVEEHLKLPLFKGRNVRSSNWSRPLDMDQIIYSASDAYASVQLFAVLEKERLSLRPTPPRPAFAELNKPIVLATGAVTAMATDDAVDEADLPLQEGDDAADDALPLSPEMIAGANDTIEVEEGEEGEEGEEDDSSAEPPTSSSKRKSGSSSDRTDKTTAKTPRASPVAKTFTDPRLLAAHEWATTYRESKPTAKSSTAHLRAYYLWHSNADLDPDAIATILRDPPLKTSTVEGYILCAVQNEGLPYDIDRLKADVLAGMPHKAHREKYRSLAEACGYDMYGVPSQA